MNVLICRFLLLFFVVCINPFTLYSFSEDIQTHVIANNSKKKGILDKIFTKYPHALENSERAREAGFTIVHRQKKSKIVILRHPNLICYLLKGYLECDIDPNWTVEPWERLLNRCIGAKNIREFIKKENIKHFNVPDKWLYIVPNKQNTVLLLVTEMNIVPLYKSYDAWKEKATKKHLNELYLILSNGYASCCLPDNIPYTRAGKFTCIDTEYPQRIMDCSRASGYLSEEMQRYWEQLMLQN